MTRIIFISNLLIALLCGLQISSAYAQVSYSGYSLIKAKPENAIQLEGLRILAQNERLHGVDFWLPPSTIGRDVSILVEPDSKSAVLGYLASNNISSIETVKDVGLEISANNNNSSNRQFDFLGFGRRPAQTTAHQDPFFADYQRYETIEKKLLSYRSHPKVNLKLMGQSLENRSIYLVQVSNDFNANKPVILIDAGHHAREWISHSTIMYMIDSILKGDTSANGATSRKSALSNKLDQYDFWFVPNVNPDGYEYSHKLDRMWRKTRSPGRYCSGTDPNRNYNFHWAGSGSSRDECSLIYAGPKAESEIEVRYLSQLMYRNRERIVMYLSLHSFSQVILWPYGYGNIAPPNEEDLRVVASAGIAGIRSHRGTSYTMGRVASVMYPAAGGSDDYAMGVCGIKYVYTIELPDKGWRGFILPSSEIVPVGIETQAGIRAMIDKMSQLQNNSS